jgi:hypothetical protein
MPRIKDIQKDNPNYTINLIDILATKDPSKTNKYLPFMINQTKDWLDWFKEELEKNTFKEMFEIVQEFEELSERNLLENKDIYSYESNQDIVDEIKLARDKVTRSEVKKKETLVIHEDEKWLLLQPLTSRSSNLYGKSTKWCVSADDHNFKKYFKDYTQDGVLLFLIDKTVKEKDARKPENNHAKLAFHKYKNRDGENLTIWNVKDSKLNVGDMMKVYQGVPGDIMNLINEHIEGDSNQSIALSRKIKID